MLGPSKADHQLSDILSKLLEGAKNAQGLGTALAALSDFLAASDAQLLKSVPAAACELAAGSVHVFDASTPHRWLAHVLATTNTDHGACAVIRKTAQLADAVVVVRKGGAPFEESETSWLQLLVPHLHAAVDLAEKLVAPLPTTSVAGQLARLFPTPCLLTDDAARCIERNDAFGKVLEALSGSVRSGRVVFDDPFLQGSWRQALLESHATAASQSLLANAPTGNQWKVHIVPVASVNSLADATPRHLMFAYFEKFQGAATQTRTLPSSRPLTKAELEVLASLLLGQTAKVIARGRGASVNTVRSQITSILGKTGHHTQKELIASFSASAFDASGQDDGELLRSS
jgi:DNA-binding CsgD family transcriptional regulator